MPPFSKAIWEAGAFIKDFKLVKEGIFQEGGIINLLQTHMFDEYGIYYDGAPRMILGIRRLEDNLFDHRAEVAANQRGIIIIGELIEQYSLDLA